MAIRRGILWELTTSRYKNCLQSYANVEPNYIKDTNTDCESNSVENAVIDCIYNAIVNYESNCISKSIDKSKSVNNANTIPNFKSKRDANCFTDTKFDAVSQSVRFMFAVTVSDAESVAQFYSNTNSFSNSVAIGDGNFVSDANS